MSANRRGLLATIFAAGLIWLVLVLPDSPSRLPAMALPLELPAILLTVMALGPGRAGSAVRIVLTALLTLFAALKLADLAMREVLGRPFNPVADLPLIDASVRVIAGSFGIVAGVLVVIVALMLAVGLAAVLWWALAQWSRLVRPGIWPTVAALAALALLPLQASGALAGSGMPVTTYATRFAMDRTALARRTLDDLRQFRAMAAADPMTGRAGLLDGIDRDVLVIFIESYGRTSFDTPFYADTHLPTLRRAEADLSRAGLAMRSGFLTSPTQGGQSWLAHSTFANGLWVDDQSRHLAALASGRQGLFHHARQAGFRTAAVMPAITRPWPEAQRMGFDLVLASGDLGYRGKPFNWVTMPDQFTLAASQRLLRDGSDPRRLFAQIALISSHAPWVPVPSMLDWDELGDGRVFDAMAEAGDPPRVVWRDRERVRLQYRKAIDYVLQSVAGYALRVAEEPPLMIVLGDHQAAASIALDERREVPIHIIGPETLVVRSGAWGLSPGMVPPADMQPIPMQAMRDLILLGFPGTEGPPA